MSIIIEHLSSWEIWLDEPTGNRIKLADSVLSFAGTKVINTIGAFELLFPADFDRNLLRLDGIVEFWRAPMNGRLSLVMAGFMRKFEYYEDNHGVDLIKVTGVDGNDLLRRRIVAYAAGSAQAEMTDQADDMMKAIVTDNLGGDASGDRDISGLNITVAGDLSDGPSITKAFSWRNVLLTLQEIAEISKTNGTDLYFDMVPRLVSKTELGFEFRTYTDQVGIDRTETTADPVIFGKEWGNLENPQYSEDYLQEENYIYAGGQGEESDREVVEVSDSTRINRSIWNLCEGFVDARNEATTNGVTSVGNARLSERRPQLKFSGTLKESPQARYGIDWTYGDKVTATYLGKQFDGMVKSLTFQVSSNKEERLQARLEVEE